MPLWLFIRALPFLMKNVSGALKLLLCLSVVGWWILATPNQKKLKCSSELSLPVENATQESVIAVHAVITFSCCCSRTGWIWRKGNIYYPHKTSPLSAASENSTQGCRQVGAACGCRPEERELLLAACFTENKLLLSDSPAEHRAVFASCNVSERWSWAGKWCSEWLLHRLLLANLDCFKILFFNITLSSLQEIHHFYYFHKLHLALAVWSLWIHGIKPKLFLLTIQTTNTLTVKHYF